ncbi:MAG: tryptophan--tRNA ligase [Parcubacteria group bacterium QH_9_35_7]|nr:MAG: tryptophan--tRNA ligase [Parcubacteria group bacterium QH_9_35_7]
MSDKPTLISGVKPTGNMHLGNYLGAVKNWVELQDSGDYNCIFFIADYHSITNEMGAKKRHDQIYKTAAELIAAGIDPDKSLFFVQSHVPEHTELAWIFNCVTTVGELERMTQYKTKSDKNPNTGLLTYPVLQAADVLLYQGETVPVGEDQLQHLELTRDIARSFNHRFDTDFFPEPESKLTETPRVKSLRDPQSKMSSSKPNSHRIELADEPEVIEEKVKKAVTATEGGTEDTAPGVENLLLLLEKFGDEDTYQEYLEKEKSGEIKYGYLKQEVSSAVADYFEGFREKRKELIQDRDEIAEVLIEGEEQAREIASKNMEQVRELIGIR